MQYSVNISLSVSEMIAIKDAIEVYKDFVKEQIGDEIKAPYWARLQSIKTIENNLSKGIKEAHKKLENKDGKLL